MTVTEASILKILRTAGEATRPQLAQASGISLVSINKAVAKLCAGGELQELGAVPSGGGRPVQVYRINKEHSYHILIKTRREGNTFLCKLERLNLMGEPEAYREARFGYLDAESLDTGITAIAAAQKIRSICLFSGGKIPAAAAIAAHLKSKYNCRVHTPSQAGILAARNEGSATLCLPPGQPATCVHYRYGKVTECGDLTLMPPGACWPPAQAEDRSLQVEISARLVQMICCIIQPQRLVLYTPAWDNRQWERIRYNVVTKLKGEAPPIKFAELPTGAAMEHAARAFASGVRSITC